MSTEWKEVLISEVYDVRSGLSKSAKYFGKGYPFLSFSDVFNNYFLPDTLSQLVQSTEAERQKCSVKKGDVFLTRTSETVEELGMSSVALKDYEEATFNGFTKRLRPTSDILDPQYVGFYLRSPFFRAEVTAYSNLTTRASLNNDIIGRLKIKYPPLSTQRKIARLLSAYDELIENNLRRIQLLEEMAQQTYTEWFVRMKFPGHEHTPVDEETGLPEGWKWVKLGEVVDITSSKRIFLSDYVDEGIPFYRGKEIILKSNNDSISSLLFISNEKFESIQKKYGIPKPGDILVTAVGTLGYPYLVTKGDGEFYFKDGNLLWLKRSENIPPTFLIYMLKSSVFRAYLNSIAIGSSQKALTIKSLKLVEILLPKKDIIKSYAETSSSIVNQIENLQYQNKLLKEARDLLLPRLMTGLVDVEELMNEEFIETK